MKKRVLAVLSTLMAGTMAVGLAACGAKHTHDYKWYSGDPVQHWKVCAEDGQEQSGTRGNHDYSNGDCICGRPKSGSSVETMSLYERADYLARAVDDHYNTYENGELFAAGYYNALECDTDGLANCYEYSSLLTMANYLYATSSTDAQKTYYKKLLDGYVAGLDNFTGTRSYISTHGKYEWKDIYCVHRGEPGAGDPSVDMVYDDLMWIIRDFMKINKTTGETKYIALAENLTNACLDGWDSTKGGIGGIVWGPTYESKHTCSNGPLISALCDLAEYYKDKEDKITEKDTVYGVKPESMTLVEWKNMVGMTKYDYYLEWAKTVYDFTYKNLRSSDYTFVDIIRGSTSTVVNDPNAEGGTYHYFNPSKTPATEGETFTYNTGSVISGAAGLYRLTGDETYLTQGRLMAEGAYHHFVKTTTVDGREMQMYDCKTTLLFNEVLMQGYLDLADACKAANSSAYENVKAETAIYAGVFKTSLNYAFDNYLINRTLPHNYLNGWLYASEAGAQTFDTHKDIKDATASPTIMALIVMYENNHGTI